MTTAKKIHAQGGYEFFARFDQEAEVYEIFTEEECEGYIGVADGLADAKEVAKAHAAEMAGIDGRE
ncbi:hypothetical protein VRRI112168_02575 [Vreelandella rituensis]|uniref:Uncharacterized protein n=1 Tax=Vreelandella rituensis TaxID=2282306 RepID=A0A368U8W3_9GAMM|nr:hypothetical protein [Halomonas rituensis]RCV93629.1 hypothetical protein DU506_00295 [Halomonas rituensis]